LELNLVNVLLRVSGDRIAVARLIVRANERGLRIAQIVLDETGPKDSLWQIMTGAAKEAGKQFGHNCALKIWGWLETHHESVPMHLEFDPVREIGEAYDEVGRPVEAALAYTRWLDTEGHTPMSFEIRLRRISARLRSGSVQLATDELDEMLGLFSESFHPGFFASGVALQRVCASHRRNGHLTTWIGAERHLRTSMCEHVYIVLRPT
jgi:hypothetical protein